MIAENLAVVGLRRRGSPHGGCRGLSGARVASERIVSHVQDAQRASD